jgi:hypothetical protein
MWYKFFFLCCFLPVFRSFSQVTILLENGTYSIQKTQEYQIVAVKDDRGISSLGKVYLPNGSKTDLILKNGIEAAFIRHLRENLKQEKNGTEVIIRIKQLQVTENTNPSGLINGTIRMEIDAFAFFDGKEIKICTARSSSELSRSFGTLHQKIHEPLIRQAWISCIKTVDNYIEAHKNKLEAFNTGSHIIFKPFQTRNTGDTVHYASRKIKWNDFKGVPRDQSSYAASIFTSIAIQTELRIIDRKITATIQPQTFMIPSQSWVKPIARDDSSLEHEQIHFDITQVIMLRLMDRLKNLEARTMDDLNSMIQYEYLEAFKEMNRLQEQYDKESRHNLNKPGQIKWKLQVYEWLQSATANAAK